MYLSTQNALGVANELLCNTPDMTIKEFNDDITSTLKKQPIFSGAVYQRNIRIY